MWSYVFTAGSNAAFFLFFFLYMYTPFEFVKTKYMILHNYLFWPPFKIVTECFVQKIYLTYGTYNFVLGYLV